jgi:hypothetical protein
MHQVTVRNGSAAAATEMRTRAKLLNSRSTFIRDRQTNTLIVDRYQLTDAMCVPCSLHGHLRAPE